MPWLIPDSFARMPRISRLMSFVSDINSFKRYPPDQMAEDKWFNFLKDFKNLIGISRSRSYQTIYRRWCRAGVCLPIPFSISYRSILNLSAWHRRKHSFCLHTLSTIIAILHLFLFTNCMAYGSYPRKLQYIILENMNLWWELSIHMAGGTEWKIKKNMNRRRAAIVLQ